MPLQKPTKAEFKTVAWLVLAGFSLGLLLNMISPRGISILTALGIS